MKTPSSANRFMIFLLLYLFILPVVIIITLPLTFPVELISHNTALYAIIVGGITSIFGFFIPIVFYCIFKCESLKNIIPHKKLSLKSILILIAIYFFLEPVTTFLSALSTLFVENNVETYLTDIIKLPLWVKTLFIAVFPAIFEELMFRGFLLNAYKKAKVWKLALVTGIFFGIMHLDINQISYAFPLGFYFAILVYYSGSIYSSMLLHFLFNFTSVALSHLLNFIPESDIPDTSSNIPFTLSDLLRDYLGSAIFAIFILFFLTKYFISINKENSLANNNDHNTKFDYYNNSLYNYDFYNIPELISDNTETKVFTPSFFIVIVIFILIMIVQNLLPYLLSFLSVS